MCRHFSRSDGASLQLAYSAESAAYRHLSYSWDFGDGSQETSQAVTISISHVFPDTAARCVDITYTVLLTVTDNKGAHASASNTATVTELPKPGSVLCPK